MAFWIHQNSYSGTVWNDLKTLCPDPGLTIDNAGRVQYTQTMTSIGCNKLATLQGLGTISIRGENSDWSVLPISGETLRKRAGVVAFDTYPNTRVVDIVYDATRCGGNGFLTYDPRGVLIGLPSDVILFHELSHAEALLLGSFDRNDPERFAILGENDYRSSRALPLRGSHDGGCQGSFPPGPGGGGSPGTQRPSTRSVPPGVCTPLLLSIPGAIGTEHTIPVAALPQRESSYVVNVNNQTTDTFTEIVMFYKRVGLPGVVYLSEASVPPSRVSTFVCGLCKNLESYVVGFFIGQDLVAQIPAQGNMTPALASQLNPTDVYPCADSWMITE